MTYVTILYFVHELFGKELVGNVWLLLVVSIVFCYALGVLSYSLGKRIRMKVLFGKDGKARKYFNSLSFEELFDKAKKDNFPEMCDEERKKMLSADSGVAYSMMWMMVREKIKNIKTIESVMFLSILIPSMGDASCMRRLMLLVFADGFAGSSVAHKDA